MLSLKSQNCVHPSIAICLKVVVHYWHSLKSNLIFKMSSAFFEFNLQDPSIWIISLCVTFGVSILYRAVSLMSIGQSNYQFKFHHQVAHAYKSADFVLFPTLVVPPLRVIRKDRNVNKTKYHTRTSVYGRVCSIQRFFLFSNAILSCKSLKKQSQFFDYIAQIL